MYSLELLFSRTHYFCSSLLARFKHYWLSRVIQKDFLEELAITSKKNLVLHELRYRLHPGTDIEIRSINDIYNLLGVNNIREPTRTLINKYISLVGRSNIVQSLIARHPLLLLYSIAVGCLQEAKSCVIEPSMQVKDHERNRWLEKERLLPYRLFDLLVAEGDYLELVEMKYSRHGKKELPQGTLLAYLASFLEKLASTETLIGNVLRAGGYERNYKLVIIVAPGTRIADSLRKHLAVIMRSVEALIGASIAATILEYNEVVDKALKELQKSMARQNYVIERAAI